MLISPVSPALNVWHLLTGTYNASTQVVSLYVDGVLSLTGTQTDLGSTGTLGVNIGQQKAGFSRFFNGSIDDVRIYNRALSAQEVQQLYKDGGGTIGQSNPVTLSTGLVGYWPFDGSDTNWATGITKDISGQGNNGQLIAMSTSTSPVIGKIGQAFNFNINTAQEVSLGTTPPALTFAYNQPFTVSLWAKPLATVSSGFFRRLFSIASSANNFEYFVMASNNAFSFNLGKNNVGDNSVAGPTYIVGHWYHLVGVYDGTNLNFYINGIKAGSTPYTFGAIGSPTGVVSIGGTPSGVSTVFPGSLDDVRVYNRALSAQEVAQLYAAGK